MYIFLLIQSDMQRNVPAEPTKAFP